ncbi:MAG TPA: choice-of-anchor D domain-containing protein, partial [Polyangiaceae bacterium]|nr:choice-of-anchor D domain-containing protein [Polyangiaceae bacterium]
MQQNYGLALPGLLVILAAPAATPGGCGLPPIVSEPVLQVDNGETETKDVFSYGRTPIGSWKTRTVNVVNVSDKEATIKRPFPPVPAVIAIPPFAHTGGSCIESFTVLAPGQSCTVDFSFAPFEVSHEYAIASVSFSTEGGYGMARFRVAGTGAYAGASLTISDGPFYDFRAQTVGTSTTKGFLVSSTGTDSAVLETVDQATLGIAPPFKLVSTSCQSGTLMSAVRELSLADIESIAGSELPPAVTSFCAVTIAFEPTAPVPAGMRLRVNYRPASGGAVQVAF